jgi:hypothetical protein
VDWTIVAATVLASSAAAIVAGVVLAFATARADLLRQWGVARLRGGHGLLVAQCALASLLLVGAGLAARSFLALVAVDPGYNAGNVLIARIYPKPGMPDARGRQFLNGLLSVVSADARVKAAAVGNMMPFTDSTYITGFSLPPPLATGNASRIRAALYVVTPGYAAALGIRIREGRFLRSEDAGGGALRVVVSREFVREYLPGRRTAGLSFAGGPFNAASTEIVGVVDDVLKNGKADRLMPAVYALDQAERPVRDEIDLVVRTAANPADPLGTVRAAVRRLDPDTAIGEAGPLVTRVRSSLAQPRFASITATLLAGLGVLLACAGLYSVLSYAVSERRRELGVRAALGATRGDLLRILLDRGVRLTACGVAAGPGRCCRALACPRSHALRRFRR